MDGRRLATFKIFLPRDLIASSVRRPCQTGRLYGTASDDIVCVTRCLPAGSPTEPETRRPDDCEVGLLVVSDADPPDLGALLRSPPVASRPGSSVILTLSRSGRILDCSLLLTLRRGGERGSDSVVLFYDPEEFAHSFVLENGGGGEGAGVGGRNNRMVSAVHRAVALRGGEEEEPRGLSEPEQRRGPGQLSEFGIADRAVLTAAVFFVGLVAKLTGLRIPKFPHFTFMESIACMPSTYCQQLQRCRRMSHHAREVTRDPSKLNQHVFKSFVWMVSFDVMLGIIVMVLLHHYDVSRHLGESLIFSAEWIGSELEKLLSWLVGAPAGLKLNRPLAKFLSNFFLHHVILWRAYINLLHPLWGTILCLCSLSGIFGFSLQVAILRDVISTMTIHVYCFYVYAARLYSLQLSALASLWRLFRGKKWNGLRNRMDSACFDIDSMFLGTLCLAFLFFLLPTALIFYVVFAALRLAVLSVQGVLGLMITAVEGLPLYWAHLKVFGRKKITGSMSISVGGASGPLHLHMKLSPVSLRDLISMDSFSSAATPSPSSTSSSSKSIVKVMKFVEKLVTGGLICPWIEK